MTENHAHIIGAALGPAAGALFAGVIYLLERRRYNRERVRWVADLMKGAYPSQDVAKLFKPEKPFLWRGIAVGSFIGAGFNLFVWALRSFWS